jgi:hypothetical protein
MIRKGLLRNLTVMTLIFLTTACTVVRSEGFPSTPNTRSNIPTTSEPHLTRSPDALSRANSTRNSLTDNYRAG